MIITRMATKLRSNTITKQSALVADLACVCRVDEGYSQSVPFSSICYTLYYQKGISRVIDRFMKRQRIFWTTFTKTIFRNSFLISVKFLNCFEKIVRFLKSDRYSSLYQPARILPLNKNINQQRWRPRLLFALKDGVPTRAI